MNSQQLVIVCNSRGLSLSLLTLQTATGQLSDPRTVPFPEVEGHSWACPMTVSPDRRFLYLGFRGDPPALLSFRIDHQKQDLDYLGKSALPANLAYLSTDRKGKFLLGASYAAGALTVSPIAADGRVQSPATLYKTGEKAHCILPTWDNHLVLATNMADDAILRFRFDPASGELNRADTPAVTVPSGTGPRHFVFHPSGRFVYVINEYKGTVNTNAFDPATGAMTVLQTSTLLPDGFEIEPAATDIHLTPDGALLYAAERSSNTLTGFAVDAQSGLLTFLCREVTALSPRGFTIDPTGRYLVALGQTEDELILYSIDASSGQLQRLRDTKVGGSPNWVEIVPLSDG